MDLINTFAGFISVTIAVVALWLETRKSRISLQADILMRLDDKFATDSLRKMRQTACKKLLAGEKNNSELSEVLNFFTLLSYMVNENALEPRMAFLNFEYWSRRYWLISQEHIMKERSYDPGSWENFEMLLKKFDRLSREKGWDRPLSEDDLKRFMLEETNILLVNR